MIKLKYYVDTSEHHGGQSRIPNMKSLLVRERIANLKQCCNWLFQKKIKEEKSFSKPPFYCFYQTFRKLELSIGRFFFKVLWEFELSRVNCISRLSVYILTEKTYKSLPSEILLYFFPCCNSFFRKPWLTNMYSA